MLQAVFCRRRHHARRPPLTKIRPGSPAPAMCPRSAILNAAAAQRELADSFWIPKFMYFTKYKRPPPTIQSMSGGDHYRMTVWWDCPHNPKAKQKWGTPQDCSVFVSKDGSLTVLHVRRCLCSTASSGGYRLFLC